MKNLVRIALALLAAACSAASPRVETATLFHNGVIYLGAPEWKSVEALLVVDGRVVATGSEEELSSQAPPRTERVDLAGAVALPGLQDAHGHVEGLGEALEIVDLRGAASFDEVVERVRRRALETAPGEWIRGRGWDQNLWSDKRFPTHAALSAATPDHAVLLERVDGHALIANAKAMQAARVDRVWNGELEIPGGRVLLDATQRPTGVFVDAATAPLERAAPRPDRATRERRWLAAQARLLELGVTCVHDMGVSRETVELLKQLRDDGRLKLRLVEYLSGSANMTAADLAGYPLAPDAADRLCAPGVKLYADGALGSRGAALLAPYDDEPANLGLLLMSREELRHCIELCAAADLQPAVHAIGDRANREVLDAFEAAERAHPGFSALRPRVEHAQVVAPEDWPRFDALGAIASMQPTHATSDMPWAPARLGAARVDGAYAWRRLTAGPGRLAFGSDFPVERPDPLEGVYAAITCASKDGEPPSGYRPDQRLSAAEALAAFTLGAARAVHQEDRRGRLAEGCFADLTVLDVDPLRCEPRALLSARTRMTVINGEVVYRAP